MPAKRRRRLRLVAAIALTSVLASLAVSTSAAQAVVLPHGEILMKGPGSLYAQGEPFVDVSLPVTAGQAAKFPVQVANDGPVAAQFDLFMYPYDVSPGGPTDWPMSASLTFGQSDVTDVAEGDSGYFTNYLAPGKFQQFTLSITMKKLVGLPFDPHARASVRLILKQTFDDGQALDLGQATATTVFKQSTGTEPADAFITTSGQAATIGGSGSPDVHGDGLATATPLNPNGTATFSIKVQNNAADTHAISVTYRTDCARSHILTGKVGTLNISTDATSGFYITPPLAHGKFVTVTLQVKRVGSAFCGYTDNIILEIGSRDGPSSDSNSWLLVNDAAAAL